MKYLKVFETTTEQQSYLNGDMITPSITITRNNESTINYVSEFIEGELSFPLYLTVPFIQDTPDFRNTKEYVLQNSEILTKLWDFLCQNVSLDRGDNQSWGSWYLPDNFYNDYPIYLNNIKITNIMGDFNVGDDTTKPSMLLFQGNNIHECSMTEDSIYLYIYSPLITFTYEGNEYYAREGMSWWQFIHSSYNTGAFTANSDTSPVYITINGITYPVGYSHVTRILANDVIEDRYNYMRYIESGHSGGSSD